MMRIVRGAFFHAPTSRQSRRDPNLRKQTQLLLVCDRRDDHPTHPPKPAWVLPGGQWKKGDMTEEDTLWREIWEETKTDVTPEHREGLYKYMHRRAPFSLYLKFSQGSRPPIARNDVPTKEILECRWFPLSDIPITGREPGANGIKVDPVMLDDVAEALKIFWGAVQETKRGHEYQILLRRLEAHKPEGPCV